MRRKEANPNKSAEKVAEKKEKKAQRDADRLREERNKKALFKYGGGALVTFVAVMCVYSLFTIVKSSIPQIQLSDTEKMKEVFFGGDPWLVMCANENVTVPATFVSAARKASLGGSVRYGAIDCSGKLPSNRTFFQRFKLPQVNFTKVPTGYLFANSEPPQKIPDKYMADPNKISDWAEKASKPSIKEVAWGSTFDKACLQRDACVMIHSKSKYTAPDWVKEVMSKHRGLRFVSINRKMHKTSFDEKVRAPRKDDVPRLAILSRVKKESGESEYTVTPYRGDWSKGPVDAFVKEIAAPGAKNKDSAVLEDTPWFDVPPKGHKTKASKETADKNKAWREQQRKNKQSGGGGGGGGDFEGGRAKTASKEDEAADEERRRLKAARQAEQQLAEGDDDDMVVTDMDDEEDDGLI